jgi:DNA-binding LytR/AlgR family response regulator
MKIVIVDDEQSSIAALANKLERFPETNVIGTASNGYKGLELIRQTKPDLLFLDVEMPDISGIIFLDKMKDLMDLKCHIIIYSSYESYMLPAFRKEAFDFLHKPLDDKELEAVMERYYAHQYEFEIANKENKEDNSPGMIMAKQNKKILLYTNAIDFRLVHLEDVCVFAYNRSRRIWEVVVLNEEKGIPLKRCVTSKMILELSPHFIQVHQSYIINFNYLTDVTDNTCHFYPPFDTISYVRVGRLYRHKLVERFCSL